eukprot:4461389-Alexandrium_andersonii.AAC.1
MSASIVGSEMCIRDRWMHQCSIVIARDRNETRLGTPHQAMVGHTGLARCRLAYRSSIAELLFKTVALSSGPSTDWLK